MTVRSCITNEWQRWLLENERKGLQRDFRWVDGPQTPHTIVGGKRVLLLASNSYLGLSSDPRIKQAAIEAIKRYGTSSGGSRLTTGSTHLHRELEDEIAKFKGTEAALVFNAGYIANTGIISALADTDWVIFCDKLNHASIIDGIRLSGAKLVVYHHADPSDLEKKAARFSGRKGLIVSDGVFSMDGDIAPIPEILRIAEKYGFLTMIDDAHATGVIGEHGGGSADYFLLDSACSSGCSSGCSSKIDIQMGTFSKALASEGAYVAGSKILIDYLRHRTRPFIYSTAFAPSSVAAALAAVRIVRSEPERREKLLQHSHYLRQMLRSLGLNVPDGITPIIPVIIGDAEKTAQLSLSLFNNGIFIPAIRPPTVKHGMSRLRISIMATHELEDLQHAASFIAKEAHVA